MDINPIRVELFSSFLKDDIQGAIDNTIRIQSSLIASRLSADSDSGFLISSFSPNELERLLNNNGKLYSAKLDDHWVGYLLITPISEFTSLLSQDSPHASEGHFIPKYEICLEDFDYVYQIGVLSHLKGHGIGKSLLSHAKLNARKSLLADILIDPIPNERSFGFFLENGFEEVGSLELAMYRTFGKLKSKVLIWIKRES